MRVAEHAKNIFSLLRPSIDIETANMGVAPITEEEIYYGALYHDIGKLKSNHYLLPLPLQPPKANHVVEGYSYLISNGFPESLAIASLLHHEGWHISKYFGTHEPTNCVQNVKNKLQSIFSRVIAPAQNREGLAVLFNAPLNEVPAEFKRAILISHIIKIADEIDDRLVPRGTTVHKFGLNEYMDMIFKTGKLRPEWRETVMGYVASLN